MTYSTEFTKENRRHRPLHQLKRILEDGQPEIPVQTDHGLADWDRTYETCYTCFHYKEGRLYKSIHLYFFSLLSGTEFHRQQSEQRSIDHFLHNHIVQSSTVLSSKSWIYCLLVGNVGNISPCVLSGRRSDQRPKSPQLSTCDVEKQLTPQTLQDGPTPYLSTKEEQSLPREFCFSWPKHRLKNFAFWFRSLFVKSPTLYHLH